MPSQSASLPAITSSIMAAAVAVLTQEKKLNGEVGLLYVFLIL